MLLYGREPNLPTTLEKPPDAESPEGYLGEVQGRMQSTWELARKAIGEAQKRQKYQHACNNKNNPQRDKG